MDTDYALAVGSRLNKNMCAELVIDTKIKALPEEYRALKADKLLAFCNSDDRVSNGAH